MSNSLDPDLDRHNVGPDLGPNCLQKLSAKVALARNKLNTHSDIFSGVLDQEFSLSLRHLPYFVYASSEGSD